MIKTTVFITCLLTVIRTLYLVKPLVKISTRCIMAHVALFILYETILVSLAFSGTIAIRYYWWELATLPTLLNVIIVIAGLTSIQRLLPSPNDRARNSSKRRNVDTSITVLILATLFSFFNIPFCVVHIWECVLGPGSLYRSVHNQDAYFFFYTLCVPLNSALNPVVYFARNQKLRAFVLNKLRCGSGRHFSRSYRKGVNKSTMRCPNTGIVNQGRAADQTITTDPSPTSARKTRPKSKAKNVRLGKVIVL